VLEALLARTWREPVPRDPYHAAVQRAVQSLVVTRLMDLAADADATPQVRAVASASLRDLFMGDTARHTNDAATDAHLQAAHEEIERFLARPAEPRKRPIMPSTPPGDPIGAGRQQ
jgi:hypothetical protein